ncbi:MAG TPA: hypothetical protein VG713_05495 [Pirellulales bacterium]|jgi:hypothetical protein|nr:hypothetical protein [Pirellulales bacterium]
MQRNESKRWVVLVAANAVVLCVLGLWRGSEAQDPTVYPPFANAVDQQNEIIGQLRELNRSVKEQNLLLKSGALRVVVDNK